MKNLEKRAREALIELINDMSENDLLETLESIDSDHEIFDELYQEEKEELQRMENEYYRGIF